MNQTARLFRVPKVSMTLGVGFCLSIAASAQAGEPPRAAHHPTRLLLRRDTTGVAAVRPVNEVVAGARTLREFRAVPGLSLIEVPDGDLENAMRRLSAEPGVRYVEPDYRLHAAGTPNDPRLGDLWGMQNTGQTINEDPGTAGADIRALSAWQRWTGSQEFRIAVIDSGVDTTHPDLIENIWTNPGEIPDNGKDDDDNGYVDDLHGFDFANDDPDPADDAGHGTHVAGIIAARGNNGVGVVGVNWNASIVALKFLDGNGDGDMSNAVDAIDYMIANDIKLSNNSWGCIGCGSSALRDAIEALAGIGHIFVAAAGNGIQGVGVNIDFLPFQPAAFDLPNIISVAAINNDDRKSGFSNFGPVGVDLGAPGVNVVSTLPGDGYGFLNGTSMASPHVAGVVALVMSRHPDWPWDRVRDQIFATARPIQALRGLTATGGVVDARAALGDCNGNGVNDADDVSDGQSADCDDNLVPDECQSDFDFDTVPDSCDDDIDSDGVFNATDVCAYSKPGFPVKPNGGPLGDSTADCRVTAVDYEDFYLCAVFAGPMEPVERFCEVIFDFDADADIDLVDVAFFQLVFDRR